MFHTLEFIEALGQEKWSVLDLWIDTTNLGAAAGGEFIVHNFQVIVVSQIGSKSFSIYRIDDWKPVKRAVAPYIWDLIELALI